MSLFQMHTPTHTWWGTHTFLHKSCSLSQPHTVFFPLSVHAHKHAHTYAQNPSYLKYCSAIDRCCWHRPCVCVCVCVCESDKWKLGEWDVELERYRGKFRKERWGGFEESHSVGGVRGQRGVSKDRNWLSAALVACTDWLWISLENGGFLISLEKCVSTRPPCCGNHGSFKSRLSRTHFLMKLYSIDNDWTFI